MELGTYFVQWSHLNPSCWQSKQSFSSHGTKLKNSWMWLWAKQSIIWIIIPNRKLYKPIPRLRLQHQPKPVSSFDPKIIFRFWVRGPGMDRWVGTGLPGKWMIISGTNAIKVQAIICPNPDKSKNCAPTVIVFEMIQTAISQSKRDRAWNANEIRKKRTNFFDRCKDCRDDRDVKWDAISKIGDLRIYS